MQFIKSADSSIGENDLANSLVEELNKGPVLWLISGGSNIALEVQILKKISPPLTKNLNIMLVDERLGPSGHKYSNYQQLLDSGLKLGQANFPNVLENYSSPLEALSRYNEVFTDLANKSSTIIGQLGIGTDGHIAGILPGSQAISSAKIAITYDSPPYKRLTLTLKSLKNINQVYVFCFGLDKRPALERLLRSSEDVDSLPSKVLCEIKNVKVYNDQLKGER